MPKRPNVDDDNPTKPSQSDLTPLRLDMCFDPVAQTGSKDVGYWPMARKDVGHWDYRPRLNLPSMAQPNDSASCFGTSHPSTRVLAELAGPAATAADGSLGTLRQTNLLPDTHRPKAMMSA